MKKQDKDILTRDKGSKYPLFIGIEPTPVGLEWLTTSLTSEMVGSRAETKLPYGSFSRNENAAYSISNNQNKKNMWVRNITSADLCDFSVYSVVKREESTTENHKESTKDHQERTKNFDEVANKYPISNIQYSILNNRSGKSTWADNTISVALCDFSEYSVVKRKESTTENHKESTKDHEERTKNFDEVRKEYPIFNIQYSILNNQSGSNTWVDNTTSVALCDFSVYSVVKRKESTTKNHKESTKDHQERIKNFDEVANKYPISNIQYSILNNRSGKSTCDNNIISVVLCDFSVYSVVKRKELTTENHKENTKDHEGRTKNFDEVANKYRIFNIQYLILNNQSGSNTWDNNTISVALCDFSVCSVVKLIISNEQRATSNKQQATKYYKQSPHLPRGGFNSGDRPGAAAITIYSLFSSLRGTSCFAGFKRLAHKRSLPVINQQAFHQGSIVLPDKGDKIRFSESGGLETYPDYQMKGFKTRKEVCRDIN
ncbi:hypothetical protein D1164_08155 [Mariniphaga sediminis]|uniref:Uncharacterized protein n=1 Tax=Mariniphaga sediminis TaxID=1628158 RepID=A0A399D1V3_9BACT|nr:hypothetical protein [Mariniphaga sediminis]RIH65629.1 hypothetical protein D1164_08155 [Mariniphaga sediminis]